MVLLKLGHVTVFKVRELSEDVHMVMRLTILLLISRRKGGKNWRDREEKLEIVKTQTHIWLVGGRKEKRPLGRSWRKRNSKMKMDPEEGGLINIAWF